MIITGERPDMQRRGFTIYIYIFMFFAYLAASLID